MIVAFSAEMEIAGYWMRGDPKSKVVVSLIQRKLWNKERNSPHSRDTLYCWACPYHTVK